MVGRGIGHSGIVRDFEIWTKEALDLEEEELKSVQKKMKQGGVCFSFSFFLGRFLFFSSTVALLISTFRVNKRIMVDL